MSRDELLDIADYIIKQTALMASELLYEKLQGENKWISQTEAVTDTDEQQLKNCLYPERSRQDPTGTG